MGDGGSLEVNLGIEILDDDLPTTETTDNYFAWLGQPASEEMERQFGAIQFSDRVLTTTWVAARDNLDREVGGFLVGRRNSDGSKSVAAALQAPIATGETGQFRLFDGFDAMQSELQQLRQDDPTLEFLGWWHSHPPEDGDVSSWEPVPGGGRTNGDLGVTSLLAESYGVVDPEMLILQTHGDGKVNFALYRWDAEKQAAVHQPGIQFGQINEGDLGLIPDGVIDYWTLPEGGRTEYPLNASPDIVIEANDLRPQAADIDAFAPLEGGTINLSELEVNLINFLRSQGIADPSVLIEAYTDPVQLGILEISRQQALQLASNILRKLYPTSNELTEEVDVAAQIELSEAKKQDFVKRFGGWLSGILGKSPEATLPSITVYDEVDYQKLGLSPKRLDWYAHQLVGIYGEDEFFATFNSRKETFMAVRFLKHFDQAMHPIETYT